jgi:hypothetical protein
MNCTGSKHQGSNLDLKLDVILPFLVFHSFFINVREVFFRYESLYAAQAGLKLPIFCLSQVLKLQSGIPMPSSRSSSFMICDSTLFQSDILGAHPLKLIPSSSFF